MFINQNSKIKLRKYILPLLFICLLTMVACSNGSANKGEETSTGMPNGFIEQPQVMYNNSIYYYYATGRDEELPDGYSLVGAIEIVDSENTPDQDFHAAGVDLYAGQEIYVDSHNQDIIYLKYDTGFGKFMTDYYASENPDELNQH